MPAGRDGGPRPGGKHRPPRTDVLVSAEIPDAPAKTEADDPAGPYALDPVRAAAAALLTARAAIVKQGTCGKNGNNLRWTLDDEGTLTISGSGEIEDYSYLGSRWSRRYEGPWGSSIKALVIEEGVTSIGNEVFYSGSMNETKLTSLTSVDLPKSLVSIGDHAFEGCTNLTRVTFGSGLVQIGEGAFERCANLGAVTLPASLRTMGNEAFYGSGVTSVTFEEGASFRGEEVFRNCSRLTRAVLPSSLKSIPRNTFRGCENLVDAPLPEGLTAIGDGAFYGCSHLPRVEIPAGVSSIGTGAFQNCTGLSAATFDEGLEIIGNEAFRGCTVLRSVTIPASAAQGFVPDDNKPTAGTIGEYAFADSGVSSVTFAEGSKVAADQIFQNCDKLATVNLASTMTSIGYCTFYDCDALEEVEFPARMRTFEPGAFYSCDKLASLTLPEGFDSMYNCAFLDCISLKTVSFPSTITTIDHDAFNGCRNLETVSFPENTRLDAIGENAFQGCVALRSVVLPESSSVSAIGAGAFRDCSTLGRVELPFADTNTGVRSIGGYAFYNCKSLKNLILRDGPTDIGESAFQDCLALPSLTFSNKVTTVGQNAFSGCVTLAGAVYFGSEEDWSYTNVSSGNQPLLTAMANADYREIEVTRVELNESVLRLSPAQTATLTAAVIPWDATDRTVVWTSENPAVASVSDAGAVRALAAGETLVTASAGGKSAVCRVIVDRFPVESVTLDRDTLELTQGEGWSLQAAVGPDYAADKTVTWTSSDSKVASVAPDGTVMAVGPGEAVITAKAGEVTAVCTVTVTAIPVERVTLDHFSLNLRKGEVVTLSATVEPENATDKTVVWASSAPGVASVSPDGVVTALAAGEARITATAGGKSASCTVTVTVIPVQSVTLNRASLELLTGGSAALSAAVLPANATDRAVAWASSAPKVASVSPEGVVAALREGTAVITATAGGKRVTCTVTVRNTPTASAVIQNPGQERTVVKTALFGGGGLPEDARVIAVIPGQGAPSRIAFGRPSNGSYVIFDTRLTGDWKLFFLDGKTLAPLAKPTELK